MEQRFTFIKTNEVKEDFDSEERVEVEVVMEDNDLGQLEEKFSSFVDCKYGVTTTSGTTALHLACAAIGIKKDDQILVSSSTNMACPFAIDYCGGIPIAIE